MQYTRANVAYSRATDLTVSACPVNMQGTTGMAQVLSALLHGACTADTNDKQTSKAYLWSGLLPICLVEYHHGRSRRLRLVLTQQSHLTKGEKSLLDEQHPMHSKIHLSGLLFGYAPEGCTEPDLFCLMGACQMRGSNPCGSKGR